MKILLALLPILWRERVWLAQVFLKWGKLPVSPTAMDGEAVFAMVKKWEPAVYEIAKSGFSLPKALAVFLARTFTPHKMTRQEEDTWFKRMSGDGQF